MIVCSMAYLQLRWNSLQWVHQRGIMAGMLAERGMSDIREYS